MTMTTTPQGTFAQWLTRQEARGTQDPIGWLAASWASFAGPDRPKLSAPSSIKKFLAEHGSQDPSWQSGLDEAMDTAVRARTAEVQEASIAAQQPAEPQPVRYGDATEPGDVPPDDQAALHAAGAVRETDFITYAHPGPAMPLAPPELGLPGLAAMLGDQLGQIQAQLGIVMQMLAASSQAAAGVLLGHLQDQALEAGGPAAGQVTDLPGTVVTGAQATAQQIAQANGWLPPPPAGMAGGWEQWHAQANQAPGEGDG